MRVGEDDTWMVWQQVKGPGLEGGRSVHQYMHCSSEWRCGVGLRGRRGVLSVTQAGYDAVYFKLVRGLTSTAYATKMSGNIGFLLKSSLGLVVVDFVC